MIRLDISEGYATTLGRYLGRDTDNRDQYLEFTFWGLNDWRGIGDTTGARFVYNDEEGNPLFAAGSLFSPFPTTVGGFNRADFHALFYQSDINNYELNLRLRKRAVRDRLVLHPNGKWRRECQPGRFSSLLLGARVMSFDESLRHLSRGVIQDVDADGNVTGTLGTVSGDYAVTTHNDLIGLQAGYELIQRDCRWTWGARVKAGPFINFSDQLTRAISDGAVDPFSSSDIDFRRNARNSDVALVGEFGFFGSYKIRPNIALNLAYDFMWIAGLAMAPDQMLFDVNPPLLINDNGVAYVHGLTLGFEWRR